MAIKMCNSRYSVVKVKPSIAGAPRGEFTTAVLLGELLTTFSNFTEVAQWAPLSCS